MTFILVLVTLLIERFFDWSHLRQWGWYSAGEKLALKKIPGASPYLVLAGTILPILLAVLIADRLLASVLYGFLALIFQILVILYCYGPHNLWADAFASISAVTNDDAKAATDKLRATFNVSADGAADSLHRQLLNQIFISSNQRVFAVIFWYAVLGLPGAVLYRLLNVATTTSEGVEISSAARTIEMLMDWIPVRLVAFIFALAGNFTHVLSSWRSRVLQGPESNDVLLAECGMAAITSDSDKITLDGSMERSAVSLLDRVFIIVLVVVIALVFII